MSKKEKIQEIKRKNPDFGYKKIAELVGCHATTVRFHLNETYRLKSVKRKTNSRQECLKQIKLELGGKCEKCGYDKCIQALCFHHKNPKEKSFTLGSQSRSIAKCNLEVYREEAKKCELLCAN